MTSGRGAAPARRSRGRAVTWWCRGLRRLSQASDAWRWTDGSRQRPRAPGGETCCSPRFCVQTVSYGIGRGRRSRRCSKRHLRFARLDGQAVSGCSFRSGLDPAPMLSERHAELALAEQDTARALPPRPHLAGGGFRKPGKLTPFEKRQDHVAIIPDDGDRALVAGFLPPVALLDIECVELTDHDNVLLHAAVFAGNNDVTLTAL